MIAPSDSASNERQVDLLKSLINVGGIQLAQGNLPEALKSFSDGLAIATRLAHSDPSNDGWQNNLMVCLSKLGDVQLAQHDLSAASKSFREIIAIAHRQVQSDPQHANWRNVLFHFLRKTIEVGDAQMERADSAGALKSYGEALAIYGQLAKADPNGFECRYAMAATYLRVGGAYWMAVEGGDDTAFTHWQTAMGDGQAIAHELVAKFPDRPEAKNLLERLTFSLAGFMPGGRF